MKKVWIIKQNNHLGYENIRVLSETEKYYISYNSLKIKKSDAYFTERDVINAIIARSADQLNFYKHCITQEENKINQLIERKKYL